MTPLLASVSATDVAVFAGVILLFLYQHSLARKEDESKSQYPSIFRKGRTWFSNGVYFNDPWSFLRQATQNGPSMFRLGSLKVIALPEEERLAFFNNRPFGFALAYVVILGSIPSISRDYSGSADFDITLHGNANKRVSELVKPLRLSANLPNYLLDIQSGLDRLGSSGVTDPWTSVFSIVFRLSTRTLCSRKIANDLTLCNHVEKLFLGLEDTGTARVVMFPFIPWPDRCRRMLLMWQYLMAIRTALQDRVAEGRCEEDPLQLLIDKNHSLLEVMQFTMSAMVAAIANTGIVAAYLTCYLVANPEWGDRVRAEYAALKARSHAYSEADHPSLFHLSDIPFEDWEAEMPSLALCLRETIRLHISTPLSRLNTTGADYKAGNVVVPANALMIYHTSFVHHNDQIYPNSMQWDPLRHSPERAEGSNVPFSFAGWGLGSHVCLGKKLARFQIAMVVPALLDQFELSLADKHGLPVEKMAAPCLSDQVISRPKVPVLLKYERRRS